MAAGPKRSSSTSAPPKGASMKAPARAHELLDELFELLVSEASGKPRPAPAPSAPVKPADEILQRKARHAIRRRGFAIEIGRK